MRHYWYKRSRVLRFMKHAYANIPIIEPYVYPAVWRTIFIMLELILIITHIVRIISPKKQRCTRCRFFKSISLTWVSFIHRKSRHKLVVIAVRAESTLEKHATTIPITKMIAPKTPRW